MPDGENEFKFFVSLDIGWAQSFESTMAGVVPINTLAAVNQHITPFNIIQFGGRSLPGWNQNNWGGLGTAVIHVEMNGWGVGRSNDNTGKIGESLHVGDNWPLYRPSGWNYTTPSENGTVAYWPFQPGPYSGFDYITPTSTTADVQQVGHGDYVRLVGTLWQDEPHVNNYTKTDWVNNGIPGHLDGKDAMSCWKDATGDTQGWTEMHTVDFMDKLTPPKNPTTIAAYAICAYRLYNGGSLTPTPGAIHEQLVPAPPWPNSHMTGVTEMRDNANITFSTLSPPYSTGASTLNSVDLANHSFRVDLDTSSGYSWGVFKAVYAATWNCTKKFCPANSCAGSIPDGCGGTLDCTGACAAGTVCLSDLSCCTPQTCAQAGLTCGPMWNGCNASLDCGTCPTGSTCAGGACQVTDPNPCRAPRVICECNGACAYPATCNKVCQ